MSTQVCTLYEFRCNHCWRSNYADVEVAETEVPCQCCGQVMLAPPVDDDRIARAEAAQADEPISIEAADNPYQTHVTDRELEQLSRQEQLASGGAISYEGYPDAPLVLRLFATLIDGFLVAIMFVLGAVPIVILGITDGQDVAPTRGHEGIDAIYVALCFFMPLVFTLVQWNLIATRGQTIGKMLCCIRIVGMDGSLPGFLNGVVLRNWLRYPLNMIPFFGLIDHCWALGPQSRCLHDIFSGTRVVQS